MTKLVNVDEQLIANAATLVGETDHEETVARALREFIRRRDKMQALLDVAGKIEFYEGFDHKRVRKTRYDDAS